MKPEAREDQLVVTELGDEVLVYDLARHQAHCLNRTAAQVWRACDGKRSVTELAAEVGRLLGATVEQALVWQALAQLSDAHLLRQAVTTSLPPRSRGPSRRKIMYGLAALPAVLTILAPTAAQAASGCVGQGGSCAGGQTCCAGLVCKAGRQTCN